MLQGVGRGTVNVNSAFKPDASIPHCQGCRMKCPTETDTTLWTQEEGGRWATAFLFFVNASRELLRRGIPLVPSSSIAEVMGPLLWLLSVSTETKVLLEDGGETI